MLRLLLVVLALFASGCAERRYERPWDISAVRSIVREYGEPVTISQYSGDTMMMVNWEDRTRLHAGWRDPIIELYYPQLRRKVQTNGARWWVIDMTEESKNLMQQ